MVISDSYQEEQTNEILFTVAKWPLIDRGHVRSYSKNDAA
jgi:hypothetical protein